EAAEPDPSRANYSTGGRLRVCARCAGDEARSSQAHRGRQIVSRGRPAPAPSAAIRPAAALAARRARIRRGTTHWIAESATLVTTNPVLLCRTVLLRRQEPRQEVDRHREDGRRVVFRV